jgi:hypothetical protein
MPTRKITDIKKSIPAAKKALITPKRAIRVEPKRGPKMELTLALICPVALAFVISSLFTSCGSIDIEAGLKKDDEMEIKTVPTIKIAVFNISA